MVARHLPQHLPGTPTNIVVQMMPGPGSIPAANHLYNVAPQDGTVIGALQRNVAFEEILGNKAPKFDPLKLYWIGSLSNENTVIAMWETSQVKRIEDAFKYTSLVGSSGANTTESYPALMNNTLGAKFKVIHGYKSTGEIRLAMERKEVEGISQSWSTVSEADPSWQSRINVIVQLTLRDDPELTKKGVPTIFQYITKDRVLPQFTVEEVETFFRIMLTPNVMGRPFAMGPGIPPDRAAAVRKAFVDMAKSPEFQAEAAQQNRDVTLVTGDEIHDMIKKVAAAPQATLGKLGDLIKYQDPK